MEIIKSIGKRYKAEITAGSLKVQESRHIANLLLRQVDAEGWKDAIVKRNVLQARSPATARQLTKLIRGYAAGETGRHLLRNVACVLRRHLAPCFRQLS
jgi:hypothetical protein